MSKLLFSLGEANLFLLKLHLIIMRIQIILVVFQLYLAYFCHRLIFMKIQT